MTKQELADYLANLHTLMEAQEATGINKSPWLIDEYNSAWAQFKETIKDETGTSES